MDSSHSKRRQLAWLLCSLWMSTDAFVGPRLSSSHHTTTTSSLFQSSSSNDNLDYLKSELTAYLAKRAEANADEQAKAYVRCHHDDPAGCTRRTTESDQDPRTLFTTLHLTHSSSNVGKVVGGTKGNLVLEYISGAPNKPQIVETPPNVLDYDELTKYGYAHLVTPIMQAGGRTRMYDLLGLEAPALAPPKVVQVPKLEIDRTGANDPARYKGLKLGQVLDDDSMAQALAEAQAKRQQGTPLRPQLLEEQYVQPFADKRNISPAQTPDWTVERLDEYAQQQGKVQAWARQAREGAFVKDVNETLDLEWGQRIYSIVTTLLVAAAFGKATPTFLVSTVGVLDESGARGLQLALEAPAVALSIAAVGSMIVCGMQAGDLNRDRGVWAVKGLVGGPLSVRTLRSLEPLQTRGEMDR